VLYYVLALKTHASLIAVGVPDFRYRKKMMGAEEKQRGGAGFASSFYEAIA
jgi:hypothetical protein